MQLAANELPYFRATEFNGITMITVPAIGDFDGAGSDGGR